MKINRCFKIQHKAEYESHPKNVTEFNWTFDLNGDGDPLLVWINGTRSKINLDDIYKIVLRLREESLKEGVRG